MDFTAIVIFLIFYFVRFQDWVPGIAGLPLIKPIMGLGFWGLLTRERRTPPWRAFTTPHEWLLLIYMLHGLYVDADWADTFDKMLPAFSFFFLASQSLNTESKLDRWFVWWAACVAFMGLLGVLTDMGIDITKARELIDDKRGRLCLNTWLLDNPNALGHTMVTAYPLIYFTMIFRRGVGSRILSVPLLVLVTQCVIATESKGAYLSGAAAIASSLLVGRSRLVQLVVLAGLFFAGSSITTMLPRMVDKEALRYDEGVMGRAHAFQAARDTMDLGQPAGWNRFQASFQWEGATVDLSTHSSIVQVGADQGQLGLFLYVSLMGLAARSCFQFKTESDVLERVRRLIFALLVGYFVSGWMINRSYHTEFFIMIGAAVAYHKLARESIRREAGLEDVPEEEDENAGVPTLTVMPDAGGTAVIEQRTFLAPWRKLWNRYGIIDFAVGYGLLYFCLWLWQYIIDYFIME